MPQPVLLRRLTATLGICAICLGATFESCSFFGIGSGDSEITVDLATAAPADLSIVQVVTGLSGLEFVKSDGGTETLTFDDTELVDLVDFESNTPLRLFTAEELPEGVYTGVRLLFDTDDAVDTFVTLTTGDDFDLVIPQGDYTAIDFTVDEDESDELALTLTLDMRLSLSFDDVDNEYSLTPVLRSVTTEDAGQISGTVNVACPAGSSLLNGAVYLFQGDVEPDDRDTLGVEPYATAPVLATDLGTQFSYVLRFLEEGDYTIAVTCDGDEEHPGENDDLRFQNASDVTLDREESLIFDID